MTDQAESAIALLLAERGCDCDCHPDERPDDVEPCMPCRAEAEWKALIAARSERHVVPTTQRLLPCPFCAGTAELQEHMAVLSKRTTYVVACISCAAEGPWQKSSTSAARWWNTRAGT